MRPSTSSPPASLKIAAGCRRADAHRRAANYAALGLPILGSVLGEGSSTSLSVAVSIACGSVLMTPFCLLILEREKARAEGKTPAPLAMLPVLMWRSIKKPIVMGPLLGVIFPPSASKCRTCCWRRSNRWGCLPPLPRCS
jgi:malonate transporter